MNKQNLPEIYLEQLKESNFDLVLELYSNIDTAYWSGIKIITNKNESLNFIRRINIDSKVMNYVIKDTLTNENVGLFSIYKTELFRKPSLEIGYAILPQYRNKGYAKSAILKIHNMIVSHSYFSNYKYLVAKYYIDNFKSANLLYLFNFKPVSEGTTFDIYGNKKITKLVYREV